MRGTLGLLADTGSEMNRREAWRWLGSEPIPEKRCSFPSGNRGKQESPAERLGQPHAESAQMSGQDEGAHSFPRKTQQISLRPAQPQRQGFQGFQDYCHCWDISKRKSI